MAALRESNIELCKARADPSSDVEDVVLDAPKEMQFLLESGRIVNPSLSLTRRSGEAQERCDEGLGWVVVRHVCGMNESGSVGVEWRGASRDAERALKM